MRGGSMRKMILIAFSLACMLFNTIAYCQQLTDWERQVYYDVAEEYLTSSIPRGEGYYDKVRSKIANKHGISVGELKDIVSKGVSREPTDREWAISNELWDLFETLGKNASSQDFDRAYQQIADKYGLTLRQLYEIEYRTMEWEIWWF
jgi:hypothetical protein